MVKLLLATLLITGLVTFVNCIWESRDSFKTTSLLTYKNKVFHIEPDIQLNWYGALHYCKRHGMELASIHSLDEHNFLVRRVKERRIVRKYWIANTINQYYWANTGQRIDFTMWAKGQPDNYKGKENCAHMFEDDGGDGSWNDRECIKQKEFICELRIANGK